MLQATAAAAVMADPFRCGECEYCRPKPCGRADCAHCQVKPSACRQLVNRRNNPQPCVHHDELKKQYDAAEAKKVEEREKRRTDVAKRRARAAAAPAPAKDPVRVAAARKAAETKRRQAAQKPVDGRGSISWNNYEVDVERIDAAIAAKLIDAGADVMAWPQVEVRERPAGRGGAPTRPRLDAGWDGAFGPNVDVPDEAGLVRWLKNHAWWWELPHNLDDKAVREHVVENLELCKKHNVRPFQHGWLLSPKTWRTLLGKYVSEAARRDFYNFSCKCRRGAAEDFARRGLVVPDHCALCALIAKHGTEFADAVRDFRAAFAAKHGDGGGDDDDEADLAGEEEEDAAGAIIMKKIVQTAGGPIVANSAKSASGAFDPARRSVMKLNHRLFAHSSSCSTILSIRRYFATGSATGATRASSPPSTDSPTHKSGPTTPASARWPRPSPAASGPARRRRRRTATTRCMRRASPSRMGGVTDRGRRATE